MECFSRSTVERVGHRLEIFGAVSAEVGALGEVLTQESVGVLIGAALPWWLWVAEVDLDAGVDAKLGVLGHLLATAPSQRASQLSRQRDNH